MIENFVELINKFKDTRILVIGDFMIDEYLYGTATRVSPEAPVPVVKLKRMGVFLGGAGNVYKNIVDLWANSAICSVINNNYKNNYGISDISNNFVYVTTRLPTIKTRIISDGYQVARFDTESTHPISESERTDLLKLIKKNIHEGVDAVVVSDYDKGVVSKELMIELRNMLPSTIPIICDFKPSKLDCYIGNATVITPNIIEAEKMSGIELNSKVAVKEAGYKLLDIVKCTGVVITLGGNGMALFTNYDSEPFFYSIDRQEVFDVIGAGDTATAVLALAYASGATLEQSTWLANIAAGVVVGKHGTATVSTEELKRACMEAK